MKKTEYVHLLDDHTPCHEIDSSGSASQHELGDLVKIEGHSSLTSYLNDTNSWGMTVSEVAETLIPTEINNQRK